MWIVPTLILISVSICLYVFFVTNAGTRIISFVQNLIFQKEGTCYLNVNLQKGNGSVEVDGEFAGTAPLQLYNLSCDAHTIKIKKEGSTEDFYYIYEKTHTFTEDSILTIDANLGPSDIASEIVLYNEEKFDGTSIYIFSSPDGATITLDSSPYGVAPRYLEYIASGEHTIVLSSDGYKTVDLKINLSDNRKVTVNVDMMAIPIE